MPSPGDGRKRLVVIGGGAAGYFGAIQAAACGTSALDVIVLEAGRLPLQKVKISGGGRCNVMHDTTKVRVRGGQHGIQQYLGGVGGDKRIGAEVCHSSSYCLVYLFHARVVSSRDVWSCCCCVGLLARERQTA